MMNFTECFPETCERDYIGGARGVCINATCSCPEGFDGVDDWEIKNDCHVGADLRQGVRAFLFGLSLISITLSTIGILALARRPNSWWDYLKDWVYRYCCCSQSLFEAQRLAELDRRRKNLEQEYGNTETFTGVTFTEVGLTQLEEDVIAEQEKDYSKEHNKNVAGVDVVPLKNTPSATSAQFSSAISQASNVQNRKAGIINRKAFRVNLWLLLFGIASAGYQGILLEVDKNFQAKGTRGGDQPYHLLDFSVGLAAASILLGLWKLSFMWFASLPEAKMYAQVFRIKSVLVKYPNGFKFITDFMAYSSVFLCLLFLFVMPYVDSSLEARARFNQMALITIAISIVFWLAAMTIVSILVYGVYDTALKALLETSVVSSSSSADDIKSEDPEVSPQTNAIRSADKKLHQAQFQRGKIVINLTFFTAWFGGLPSASIAVGIAFIDFFETYFYIFFGVITAAALIGSYVVVILVVFASLRRGRKENNPSPGDKPTQQQTIDGVSQADLL